MDRDRFPVARDTRFGRRVWCPPYVKGPADKPLIVKPRRIVVPSKRAA